MKYVACGTVLILLFSCASIPKGAASLNQRISDGINELKTQHIDTIDHIYILAIEKVDGEFDYLLKTAKELFEKKNGRRPQTEEEYYTVCLIAVRIRDAILQRIQRELGRLKRRVSENYDLVADLNDEVTRYLDSAIKVREVEQIITDYMQKKTEVDLNIEEQMRELDNVIEQFIEEAGGGE